eukprot:TRINITY_DN1445_c0_g1_i1.p1 TRINITY_DN1445_c0_g1~~TRINITY_DN1445_c0_g1_i1.p1  ORF type:complete len:102 (-),score=20.87 TRINITY_DN1445_c0_g1_i1:77-382(-)
MSQVKKLIPLFDRVLIRRVVSQSQTASGILLPTKQEKETEAEVLAVGSGRVSRSGTLIPLAVKTGDVVVVPQHAMSTKITLGNDTLELISEDNIIGILKSN